MKDQIQCVACDRQFANLEALIDHVGSNDTASAKKQKCHDCGGTFCGVVEVRPHQETQSGASPSLPKCQRCNNSSKTIEEEIAVKSPGDTRAKVISGVNPSTTPTNDPVRPDSPLHGVCGSCGQEQSKDIALDQNVCGLCGNFVV